MRARHLGLLVVAGACALASCTETPPLVAPSPRMLFADDDPFAAPFPSEHLRADDGTIVLSAFPVGRTTIVERIHEALAAADGFGTTSAIHVTFSDPVDVSALTLATPLEGEDAAVELIDVDPADPTHRGERAPIRLFYQDEAGPFGGQNVLTALPVQGMPLRAGTLYALVVRRGLETVEGVPFAQASAIAALGHGLADRSPDERYRGW
jgi:hypothetical protein